MRLTPLLAALCLHFACASTTDVNATDLFADPDVGSGSNTTCVCTTVPCPTSGYNYIGTGYGTQGKYIYSTHTSDVDGSTHAVVTSASIVITSNDLDTGTGTTSCTQSYSRMLEDDGEQDCDAGHILAHRLGGLGNQPINLFPQDASINRGIYAQFEGLIYDCTQDATGSALSWSFTYESTAHTMPNKVEYTAVFDGGSCDGTQTQTFGN